MSDLSRRSFLGGLCATVIAAASPAAAGLAWLHTLPPGSDGIPVVRPSRAWTGYQSSSNTGAGSVPMDLSQSQTLLGDGTWSELAVANIDEPDNMFIDAPSFYATNSNVLTVWGSTGDPSGKWIKEIVVQVEGGTPITISGLKLQTSPRTKVPGYQFRIAQQPGTPGLWGAVRVKVTVRPYNGFEKVIVRTYWLDDFGAAKRKEGVSGSLVRFVSPSGLDTNDGLTRSTPWQTITKAMVSTPDFGICKALAGAYNEDNQGSVAGRVTTGLITIQADDGVSPSSVVIGRSDAMGRAGKSYTGAIVSNSVGTSGFFAQLTSRVLYKNVTSDITNIYCFGFSNGAAIPRQLYWQGGSIVDRCGPVGSNNAATVAGPTYDSVNNATDPDGVNGGMGYGTLGGDILDPTGTFPVNTGILYAAMEWKMAINHGRAIQFRRNVSGSFAFDSISVDGYAAAGRTNPALGNRPMLDSDDLFIANCNHRMDFTTPLKFRYHPNPTVRILSVQQLKVGQQTVTYPTNPSNGAAFSRTVPLGVALVTFDNNADGSAPNLSSFCISSSSSTGGSGYGRGSVGQTYTDVFCRFMTANGGGPSNNQMFQTSGQFAGQSKTALSQGVTSGAEVEQYGFKILAMGVQTLTLSNAAAVNNYTNQPITVDGVQYTLAANQALIHGDFTLAAPGDCMTIADKAHTDGLQYYAQQTIASTVQTYGYDNHIFINYRVSGAYGVGNGVFIQPSAGGIYVGTMDVDATGTFTIDTLTMNSSSTPTFVGMWDYINSHTANTGYASYQGQFARVISVTPGSTITGKLNRPFLDTNGNPVAIQGLPFRGGRSLSNAAFINMAYYADAFGNAQSGVSTGGGGTHNAHFLNCSIGKNGFVNRPNDTKATPSNSTSFGQGYGSIIFRNSVVPGGITDYSFDPRQDIFVINCGQGTVKTGQGKIKSYPANDNSAVALAALSLDALTFTLTGSGGRSVDAAGALIPDITGATRVAGLSQLGVASAPLALLAA